MSIILPDGTEARSLQEQVIWLTEHNAEPEKYLKEAEVDGNTLTLTNKDGTEVEFTPQGGGGQTYTAGDGLTLTNNEFDVVCGDGIEIDTDDKVAAKIGRGIFFDSDNAIALNNDAYNAINAVSSKLDATQLSGTNDGTNWTTLQIKGVTKNIPTGGSGGVTSFDQLSGRPKYAGSAMTSSTDIPVLQPGTGITIDDNTVALKMGTGLILEAPYDNISVDYGEGLHLDTNDSIGVDFDVVQHKLTAGSNITISGNTISATGGGGGSYTAGNGINITNNVISANVDGETIGVSSEDHELNVIKVPGYIWFDPDGEDLKFDGSNQIDILRGSNITFTKNGNTLTIDATGGGGTTQHLYRHDIKLYLEDAGGERVEFTLYRSTSATPTFAQIRDSLPAASSMPATGNGGDNTMYIGVRKNGTNIQIDIAEYDCSIEGLTFGYEIADSNWSVWDTVTTIF